MNDKYYRENEWWVSLYNFVPEVRGTFQLPAKVSIHDATLRDSEQTPGVVFSVADKIAEKLDEVGVEHRHRQGARVRMPRCNNRAAEERGRRQLPEIARLACGLFPLRHHACAGRRPAEPALCSIPIPIR
jgi:hypothetical protein